MMNKKPKTAFKFILAGFMLVSIATISCNNESSEKTDVKTDTTVTKMESMPIDTTHKMDTASTRPIVPAN